MKSLIPMKQITNAAELKSIQLDLLNDLIKILDENKIDYFLYYGSLLGAVRHNGFIPWDDDIDIGMTRENYEKFKIIQLQKSNLKISAPGINLKHPYFFTKFYTCNYICLEEMDHPLSDMGINIDVFPIDRIPSNMILKYVQDIIINSMLILLNAKIVKPSKARGIMRNSTHIIIRCFSKLIDPGLLTLMIDKISNYSGPAVKYGCRASIYRKNESYYKEVYESRIIVAFEGLLCSIPKEFHQILHSIYGDYWTPPEPSKRVSRHTVNTFRR